MNSFVFLGYLFFVLFFGLAIFAANQKNTPYTLIYVAIAVISLLNAHRFEG
jgi:hypothetical protein